MKAGSPARIVFFSAAALALFSTLFTLAAWYDWWPASRPARSTTRISGRASPPESRFCSS